MITQTDIVRIMKEECLGEPSTAPSDTPELAAYRKGYRDDVEKMKQAGIVPDLPLDWDDDDDEAVNESQPEASVPRTEFTPGDKQSFVTMPRPATKDGQLASTAVKYITCPHCRNQLDLATNQPTQSGAYTCDKCKKTFDPNQRDVDYNRYPMNLAQPYFRAANELVPLTKDVHGLHIVIENAKDSTRAQSIWL